MEVTFKAKKIACRRKQIATKNGQEFEFTIKRNWKEGFGRALRVDYSSDSEYSKWLELNKRFMVRKDDLRRGYVYFLLLE